MVAEANLLRIPKIAVQALLFVQNQVQHKFHDLNGYTMNQF